MIIKKYNLREKELNGFMPTLTTYITEDSFAYTGVNRVRPAVIVLAGGAYSDRCPREAEPVALMFSNAGFHAFVVDYSIAPTRYPAALYEVCEAIKLIRKNADKWYVNPNAIAVCGFSAGGHLAASVGTLWNTEPAVKCENEQNKPNALILCYPVIMYGEKAHKGSFYNLLGEGLSDEEYMRLSLEKKVSPDTPPAFLWHTFSDGAVPVENSLEFARALRQYNIPFEMHIYPDGPHGMSLATAYTSYPSSINSHVATWAKFACDWMHIMFGDEQVVQP